MHTITMYLIKLDYKNVPRYEWKKGVISENSESIFNDGVLLEKSDVLTQYLRKNKIEPKRIYRADSPYESYFRETDNPNPWWKTFWKISNRLANKSADLIVILKHRGRTFAVTHGHGRYLLNPMSFENDFGLKCALNALDEGKIKGAAIFTPSDIGLRTRKQTGRETTFEQYDINILNSLLRDIAGKVNSRFSQFFSSVDGADSLKFSYPHAAERLSRTLSILLTLYNSTRYKKRGFKWIDNFRQVRDKADIAVLDGILLKKLNAQSRDVILAYPAVFDAHMNPAFKYGSVAKRGKTIGHYLELDIEKQYYTELSKLPNPLTIDDLHKQSVILCDADTQKEVNSFRIYQCLYVDIRSGVKQYFLENGAWYLVDKDFLDEIENNIAQLPVWTNVIPYESALIASKSSRKQLQENTYNNLLQSHLAKYGKSVILDANEVYYRNGQVEVCDVLYTDGKSFYLFHNKCKHGSSALSHLFSQGNTSAELLTDVEFRKLANAKIGEPTLLFPTAVDLDRSKYHIVYGIISPKDKNGHFSIPLFSRINLDLFVRNLRRFGYKVQLAYIERKA
ncbi:MAG: TIGR04141 family sporadically distributed protein [Leptospirales bacterium]|nr:TIGR04141 family sporadically distributed protein [Leptospirales bacterium]